MNDIPQTLAAIDREVFTGTVDGQEVVGVRARRAHAAPPTEVWDALTDRERLRSWFLPVAGELREGGSFQTEGNVGGSIRRCDAPRVLVVTWGDDASVVALRLSPAPNGASTVQLEHTVPRHFAESGAGALYVGPGWDSALTALDAFLRGDAATDPAAAENGPAGQALTKQATLAWIAAVDASGTATAEEVTAAKDAALQQWAPDL